MGWSKKLPARHGKGVELSVDEAGIRLMVDDGGVGLTPNQAADLAAELLEARRQYDNLGSL